MPVRNYKDDDRKQVIALWNEVFPNSVGHNEPNGSIDRKLLADDDLFFVAVEDDHVVGTVLAGYDGHRGWLYSLAVALSHRRKGIGTELVRHAETALIRLGCPKVNLQVRADNAAVVAFYKSLEFTSEERISMGKRLEN